MKTKGMAHQIAGLGKSEGLLGFAFLCEQGTGKTWIMLAEAERLFYEDKIDAVLVLAPNGVHTNWTRREIPTHMSATHIDATWVGSKSKKFAKEEEKLYRVYERDEHRPLRIMAMNIDAVNFKHGYDAALRFVRTFRCLVILDESSRIKNPAAKRTQAIHRLGEHARYRRIGSGTPVTKNPFDVFSQFQFLDNGLLGTTSYRSFCAEYAVLLEDHHPMMAQIRERGARGSPQIVAKTPDGKPMWRNLDKLSRLMSPYSYRVTKAECLDLPDKIYKTLFFELSPAQRKIYDFMKEELTLDIGDLSEEPRTYQAIAALSKLQQITSGFVTVGNEPQLISDNPRMKLFADAIEDIDGQFIVWAKFKEEIHAIELELIERGYRVAVYDGDTPKAKREQIVDDFQAGLIDVFIGHVAAAGIGLTLTAAETVVYYSCSYNMEDRLQSEDRAHRIGTKNNVTYLDLVGIDTIDEAIASNLQAKKMLADTLLSALE